MEEAHPEGVSPRTCRLPSANPAAVAIDALADDEASSGAGPYDGPYLVDGLEGRRLTVGLAPLLRRRGSRVGRLPMGLT